MQNINVNAKVLSAENTPYDFDGNEGVSHKIRLSIADEIYSVKTSEDQVNEFKAFVGKSGKAVVSFLSPRENLKMVLVSFVEGK